MSDKKLQKEYVDHGFGFPIRLRNVPMVKVRRTWTPDLNYEALAVAVLKALCFKPVAVETSRTKARMAGRSPTTSLGRASSGIQSRPG